LVCRVAALSRVSCLRDLPAELLFIPQALDPALLSNGEVPAAQRHDMFTRWMHTVRGGTSTMRYGIGAVCGPAARCCRLSAVGGDHRLATVHGAELSPHLQRMGLWEGNKWSQTPDYGGVTGLADGLLSPPSICVP